MPTPADSPLPAPTHPVCLFLCGDVMTGRGIDQILPHPGDPLLHEPWLSSALDYVRLAAAANDAVARPVEFAYIWGCELFKIFWSPLAIPERLFIMKVRLL